MSDVPTIRAIMHEMGIVGERMVEIDAAEGAAGNLSVFTCEAQLGGAENFRQHEMIDLPVPAPALAGGWVIVTGSGRRLRDIAASPETTLCLLHINAGGQQARLLAAERVQPTSELNSHLAIHNDQVVRRGLIYHAVVHAQPLHLTYLSHSTPYGDTLSFNRRLLRWQPELIINFPEGIGLLPFEVPGTLEQATITAAALQKHRAILWQRHGIVARADTGVQAAGDLIDYAEMAARYVILNMRIGEPTTGLSDAEMRLLCQRMGITQPFF